MNRKKEKDPEILDKIKSITEEIESAVKSDEINNWNLPLKFLEGREELIFEKFLRSSDEVRNKEHGPLFTKMFELSLLKWINILPYEIPKNVTIADFILNCKDEQPWSSFIEEWARIRIIGRIAMGLEAIPVMFKSFTPNNIFAKSWFCSDGIRPKVFRLQELVLNNYYFWSYEEWIQNQDDDISESDPKLIEFIPKEIFESNQIGFVTDFENSGSMCYLSDGFGFKKGQISYIKSGHNEWLFQKSLLNDKKNN